MEEQANSGNPGTVRRSARERAYEWIGEAILSGRYAEGQFLDEVALAGEVGTSRTPVREALHRLQAESFVELVPRRGAQVRVVTSTEMKEIYQARFVIESHAATEICRHRRGAPADARGLIEAMEAAGRERDWNTMARLDQAFHGSIVRHRGNAVLAEMYEAMRPRQVRLSVRTITEAPERLDTIEREHRMIADRLAEHDGEAAVAVLATHLREVPEVVRAFPG
ncbi:GntR family transcriptional regulator [Nocardiopsis changdeensis]|uniref:GntR family transcriptional regulator n=1 Tax=Nocardiopsis changdeensis TaxID=2831969 RepID=A0ABX8BER5_9ACTN|nr:MULTISPECIES: GntR family transcriptional regulator [Nocardiopsis]QUX20747.1 GntR family transcriptional regulator [Nocardiopsis changdeensis]QYX36679.1 GntR family transcriptional regulator [Nocardiopsis sp. MT53]